jgi:predicted LPLAT superfamily acyltransferase
MQPWAGKSKGTKTGYRIFIFTLRKLGLYPAYALLFFVAFYYFLFSPSSSAPIYNYYRKHHGWSSIKSLVAVYRNYYVFGQTLIDKWW